MRFGDNELQGHILALSTVYDSHASHRDTFSHLDGSWVTQPNAPAWEEIDGSRVQTVQPNRTQGSYETMHEYLSVHYHLFREDFVRPLREITDAVRWW